MYSGLNFVRLSWGRPIWQNALVRDDDKLQRKQKCFITALDSETCALHSILQLRK